jgi:DNA repair protein RadC
MKINEIPMENRPRERLERYGANALSEAELLAIIFQSGTRKENAIDMSNRLISEFGLERLSYCSVSELMEVKGIGKSKACRLLATIELSKRLVITKQNNSVISSAKDAFDYFSHRLFSKEQECFAILLLDSKNRVMKDAVVSLGTLNASLIHTREVFRQAIRESANSVIIAHNHPSGDPFPSPEDEETTKKLFEAGNLLEIPVLDHIIIGDSCYYSFRENS